LFFDHRISVRSVFISGKVFAPGDPQFPDYQITQLPNPVGAPGDPVSFWP
jgi:hypothetical protein